MSDLNKSEYILLGLLTKSPSSGYELKNIMLKQSLYYGSESNAQIYPVLKKLEKQQLVHSNIDEKSGKRNKRIFAITPHGVDALKRWLNQENDDVFFYREDFLIKLSLAQNMFDEKLKEMIKKYHENIRKKIEEINLKIEHVQTMHKGKEDQRYLLLTFDHLNAVLQAKLAWCEKNLKT